MNRERHPSLAALSSRLQAWARDRAPALTDENSADIHTDELSIDAPEVGRTREDTP